MVNSPNSPSGTLTMTLRSSCDGSCGSTPHGSVSGKRRGTGFSASTHSHAHHHHHHHQHNSIPKALFSSERLTGSSLRTESQDFSYRVARTQASELGVSGSVRSSRSRGSLVSAVTDRITRRVTRSVFTQETKTTSTQKAERELNDNSSDDEVVLGAASTAVANNRLSDVTTLESITCNSPMPCPTPDMSSSSDDSTHSSAGSRLNFFSASTGYSEFSNQRMRGFSARASSNGERFAASTPASRNGSPHLPGNSHISSAASRVHLYGLDADSDDEVITDTVIAKTTVEGSYWARRNVLCLLAHVWRTFWRTVYWIIASVMLFDTWLLVRTRELVRSSPLHLWKFLIPLFLLLFLFGGGTLWSEEEYEPNVVLQTISSMPAISLGYLFNFVNFSSGTSDAVKIAATGETQAEWSWMKGINFRELLRQTVLQIYGHPQEGRAPRFDESKLDAMIQEAVRKQLAAMGITESGQRTAGEKEVDTGSGISDTGSAALDTKFSELKVKIEAIERSSEDIKDEFRTVKIQITEQRDRDVPKSKEEELRFSNLENLLLGLEEKILHLQDSHTFLLASMRNCCRNHSEYSAFVDRRVVTVLNTLHDTPGSESCERLSPFRSWLKTHFTTKEDMHQHMSFISGQPKTSESIEEMEARLLKATKSMIAREVQGQLREHNAKIAFGKAGGNFGGDVSEENIRLLISQQLAMYDADKTGQPDFALESSGGSVLSTRCSETYHIKTAQFSVFGVPLWYYHHSPRIVIQSGVNPGECWAFKGAQGYIVIQLSRRIKITAFSLEHIPRSISPTGEIDSAPREFAVLGLDDLHSEGLELGKYEYDQNGEPLQYFIVKEPDVRDFQIVELRILSNHGNPEYTCLYRFRVHGELIRS